MGMSKDVNNLFKEFMGVVNKLQDVNHKLGLKHKISKGNNKVNVKFNDYWKKITTWIRKEMKK